MEQPAILAAPEEVIPLRAAGLRQNFNNKDDFGPNPTSCRA